MSSQLLSFAADGKALYWDYRQLNEATGQQQHGGHGREEEALSSEDYHDKRDGKWSPLYSLPLALAQHSTGDGEEAGLAPPLPAAPPPPARRTR